MKQKIYQVDAFADRIFSGNPAAICPLDHWLHEEEMQKIAMENNLAETAFYVKAGDQYQIRWFTPSTEVDLCGHATLASAFILFDQEGYGGNVIHFFSHRSGDLFVRKDGEWLILDFPADPCVSTPLTQEILDGFDRKPKKAFKGKTDLMLVFDDEQDVRNIIPKFRAISQFKCRGVIITAKGEDVNFVSRFFAPQSGIDEDPVTGSSHTTLIPYWAGQLQKMEMTARQLSFRGGFLQCRNLGDRVEIGGKCKLYMTGEIFLPG